MKQLFFTSTLISTLLLSCIIIVPHVQAEETNEADDRMALFKKTEAISLVPWYYLAAWDQYERNIQEAQTKQIPIAITFDEIVWHGLMNAGKNNHQAIIQQFGGIGKDANSDKIANQTDPEDILFTAATYLQQNGNHPDAYHIQLWHMYNRDLSVQTIKNTAKIYKHFQSIDLTDRAFPIANGYHYTYRNTWGHSRGYGGRRIHEGTDIFASYGTPVQSTTYGIVELKGWNEFGGWRIGIRDVHNIYHYYAHLNHFTEGIEIGDIVKPGDIIGTVGSSGYGPPGTAGKFPPHLHYGMYKDNGKNEWAFDPFPYLKKWERQQ